MHVSNVLHAARWKYRTQKNRHLCTIAQLCLAISLQLRYISTIGKELVKQQYLLHKGPRSDSFTPAVPVTVTCLCNMVNFGPLAAQICWRILGHPNKFQRVLHLGSVTARHSSSGHHPDFAALNSGHHLYSAGRPSRWALAHISSFENFALLLCRWSISKMIYFRTLKWLGNQLSPAATGFQVTEKYSLLLHAYLLMHCVMFVSVLSAVANLVV